MDLKANSFYEFGRFRLDPDERLLMQDGRAISLPPKTFDLLVYLVQKHGRLATKEQIMQTVWSGSFVEDANLTVSISLLRKKLGEKDGGLHFIETIPKKGYRFTAPVREVEFCPELTFAEPVGGSEFLTGPKQDAEAETGLSIGEVPWAPEHGRAEDLGRRRRRWFAVAAFLLLGALVATGAYLIHLHRAKTSIGSVVQRPHSLAILPFQNLGQDANSDFLGVSLADAVITKLGYIGSLTVRPSSAVEKYRNRAIDISKVAADLRVDTLLISNFIREGQDLRVTSQLIDVKSERILWRSAIDVKYERLLTVQDEVARQIIKGLELNLSPSEVARLKPDEPVDPVAYEYYLRGVDLYSRNDSPMAIKMLEKSTELAPNYALTWAHLGRSYAANASFQFGGREQYRKAEAAYERALTLQPEQIEAHIYIANLFTDTGRVELAVPLLRAALRTNPNLAEAHWELGYAYRFGGMLGESIAEAEQARRLDPSVKLNTSALNSYLYLGQCEKFLLTLPDNTDSALLVFYRGFGEYCRGSKARAAEYFDRAFELDPLLFQAQVGKAFSYAIRHQEGKARQLLQQTENKIAQREVGDAEAIYKVAEAYAVLGENGSAMRMLRRSIENGFFPYPYFQTDPLLNGLRKEADFTMLMKLARQRHEAFKSAFF
jgi:DNA-binding winged helix-turn-helix (wHTH) protein/TolB-like protein